MKISDDVKLDFGDVLIKPKRSTIVSRKDVDFIRSFDTLHSHRRISGFPLIVGNMDTTGTISMWKTMKTRSAFVALHKYQTIEQMKEVGNDENNAFITIGEKKEELELLVKNNIKPLMILLDAANAYRESFVDSLKRVRETFPTSVLMAGNVCTPEMTEQLVLSGADIVKVGIGPGCFIKGTLVNTKKGYQQIEKICPGEEVLTHTGEYKKVTHTMQRVEKNDLICINNISCTKNHEFYVIKKEDKEKVNEKNIHKYAKWISAEELSDKFLLIKITE